MAEAVRVTEQIDDPVDSLGQLNVEGDDPDSLGPGGVASRPRTVASLEPRRSGVGEVDRVRTGKGGGESDGDAEIATGMTN